MTARVIATIFALVSFAAALIVGHQAGNPMVTILSRALLIMLGCYLVGRVIGGVAHATVNHHLDHYRAQYPMPEGMAELEARATGASPQHPETSLSEPAPAG